MCENGCCIFVAPGPQRSKGWFVVPAQVHADDGGLLHSPQHIRVFLKNGVSKSNFSLFIHRESDDSPVDFSYGFPMFPPRFFPDPLHPAGFSQSCRYSLKPCWLPSALCLGIGVQMAWGVVFRNGARRIPSRFLVLTCFNGKAMFNRFWATYFPWQTCCNQSLVGPLAELDWWMNQWTMMRHLLLGGPSIKKSGFFTTPSIPQL